MQINMQLGYFFIFCLFLLQYTSFFEFNNRLEFIMDKAYVYRWVEAEKMRPEHFRQHLGDNDHTANMGHFVFCYKKRIIQSKLGYFKSD